MIRSDWMRVERYHVWNFIIGVQYVTVLSHGMHYRDVVLQLSEEMGEEFKKPIVILGVVEMYDDDYAALRDLDMFDYEFGV